MGTSGHDDQGGICQWRAALSFATMLGSCLVSLALLVLLRLKLEPGLEVAFLALWSGILSAITFCVFVVPLVSVFSRRFQLRLFYVVVLFVGG